MPTYEFRCPKGHDFEKFYRSIGTAPTEVHCPECGALAERQLSAGAGLVFKGSGFYITDYGKDGKKDQQTAPVNSTAGSAEKSDAASAKSESSTTADSGAGSSDTKSSAAAESKSSAATTEAKPAAAPPSSKKKDAK